MSNARSLLPYAFAVGLGVVIATSIDGRATDRRDGDRPVRIEECRPVTTVIGVEPGEAQLEAPAEGIAERGGSRGKRRRSSPGPGLRRGAR